MDNGNVNSMVPGRDGCARKFMSSGNLRDLKIPRWSGEERIHLMSKIRNGSFTGSGVSGGLSLQLL